MMVERSEKTIEVLYVEDDPADIRLVKEALKGRRVSFHVESVPDGVEALLRMNQLGRFAEKKRPDLVLLDLTLPKLDGLQVLREIRNNARLNDIPIFILSGSHNPADADEARSLKADHFIPKPNDADGYWDVAQEIEDYWTFGKDTSS